MVDQIIGIPIEVNNISMKALHAVFTFFLLMTCSLFVQGETLINTSFENGENYTVGSVNNQQKWKVTTGSGVITSEAALVYAGQQALRTTTSASNLQVEHIAYASNFTALGGDVYVDFYIRQNTIHCSLFP